MSWGVALWLLLLASLLLRALWLDRPAGQPIFDESYYVNAARVILGSSVQQGEPYAGKPLGLDPNTEHPPLGKLLIAGSMALFGDNPHGWRIPSVLFGTAAIALVVAVVRAAGGSAATSVTAGFLFSFDNLTFIHSRIATLDIFLVTFVVLAALCYLRRWPLAAGASLALAGLVKVNGLWFAIAFVAFELYVVWRERGDLRDAATRLAKAGTAALASFAGLLFVMDHFFTSYATPLDHVRRIFSYGLALKRGDRLGVSSQPWEWILNQVQMPYYHLDKVIEANGEVIGRIPEISFTGALNPYLIFVAPLALAFAGYLAFARKSGLGMFAVCWSLALYLPFFPLALLGGRVAYIFYFLPVVPAMAIGIALLLERLPAAVRITYAAVYLLGFASLFPFRTLP